MNMYVCVYVYNIYIYMVPCSVLLPPWYMVPYPPGTSRSRSRNRSRSRTRSRRRSRRSSRRSSSRIVVVV